MKKLRKPLAACLNSCLLTAAWIGLSGSVTGAVGDDGRSMPGYDELRSSFENPDHALWGEVPLWWWEGETMTRERATAELEKPALRQMRMTKNAFLEPLITLIKTDFQNERHVFPPRIEPQISQMGADLLRERECHYWIKSEFSNL